MKEIIKSITESNFKTDGFYGWFEGFDIVTNIQTIHLGIESGQQCCESWGYLMSEDDLASFEGAEFREIKIVSNAIDGIDVETLNDAIQFEGDAVFVNIETNRGTLQFVAYNGHNGYYGHDVVVRSKTFNHDEQI